MKRAEILFLNGRAMKELGADDIRAGMEDVKKIYSLFNCKNEQGEKADKITIPDKVVLRFGKDKQSEYTNGRINAMPGRVHDDGLEFAGIKWIGSGIHNYELGYPRANALVILNDPYTKLPICIADGTAVSATRTGASGGVAVELLSRKDAAVLTLCGAGVQGRTQLKAAVLSRPGLKQVNVYDKFPASAQKYVEEMSTLYPAITFRAVTEEELGEIVSMSDIVITATTADHPIIKAGWVTKGTLLVNLSGDEMERACVLMADKTVVDFWESVKHRNSSTIARMANDPNDKYQDFVPTAEVGEILNGQKEGRENDEEIIYYNPVGVGVLDMMIVHRCYEKAKLEGKGQALVLWDGED